MMGAAQPFVSGAISKTCNLPAGAAVKDVQDAYMLGWKLGVKALAIYRDGSKGSQVIVMKSEVPAQAQAPAAAVRAVPYRRRLPDTRNSVTHKFEIDGAYEGYLTVGLYDDGTPGELFITMAKEGSTVGGLMDTVGTLMSMGLQYGVPAGRLRRQVHPYQVRPVRVHQEPRHPDRRAASIDYIAGGWACGSSRATASRTCRPSTRDDHLRDPADDGRRRTANGHAQRCRRRGPAPAGYRQAHGAPLRRLRRRDDPQRGPLLSL